MRFSVKGWGAVGTPFLAHRWEAGGRALDLGAAALHGDLSSAYRLIGVNCTEAWLCSRGQGEGPRLASPYFRAVGWVCKAPAR